MPTYNTPGTYPLSTVGQASASGSISYGSILTAFSIPDLSLFGGDDIKIVIPATTDDPASVTDAGSVGLYISSDGSIAEDDAGWAGSSGAGPAGPSVTIDFVANGINAGVLAAILGDDD